MQALAAVFVGAVAPLDKGRLRRFDGKVAVYRTAFDDFIYLADTGLELDELPVRTWVQGDATFTGWEAEGQVDLVENSTGLWTLRVFADAVDGNGRDAHWLISSSLIPSACSKRWT